MIFVLALEEDAIVGHRMEAHAAWGSASNERITNRTTPSDISKHRC